MGKVLTEQDHMKRVAGGGTVPPNAPSGVRKVSPAAPVAREASATPSAPETTSNPTQAAEQVALAQ